MGVKQLKGPAIRSIFPTNFMEYITSAVSITMKSFIHKANTTCKLDSDSLAAVAKKAMKAASTLNEMVSMNRSVIVWPDN